MIDLLIVHIRVQIKSYKNGFLKTFRSTIGELSAMNFIFLLSMIFSAILASEMSDRIYKVKIFD